MKVLHVVPGLAARSGGVAVGVVEFCLGLASCSVETTIVSTDLAATAAARPRGRVRRDELPAGAAELDVRLFPARWPYRLAFSPALARALRSEVGRYDVVHVHSLFLFPELAAYRTAIRHGIPYVVSLHGMLDPYLRRRGRLRKAAAGIVWQRDLLERAALLHLTTEDEARLVADVAPAVPRAVVPNGIDWARFENLAGAAEFRVRRLRGYRGPVVLCLGRISHKKGLDVLIRAFALASREAADSRLVIAGPDDEGLVPRLAALAVREGVAARVVFTGVLHAEERLAALAAADVFALPSHTENFGLAVAEALAAGLPTVISPAVNIAPEVERERAGVVCEPTPEALASEIAVLLRDGERRRALGARGRAFARRYDRAAVGAALARMYADVVARAARPAPLAAGSLLEAPHA